MLSTQAAANFAFDLIREENALTKSTIISPLSISIALDMVLIGAKNNTAQEIQNAIAKGENADDIHKHYSNIFKNRNNAVKIANKVYYAKDLKIFESYKNAIQKYFDGNFRLADFSKSQETADEINKFVEETTDKEIKDFIHPEIIRE